METLQRYWHWHRNERPNVAATQKMREKHLSPLAELSLAMAVEQIAARHSQADVEAQNDALAELSVEFCRALEKMHAAVPEGPPPTLGERFLANHCTPLISPELKARIDALCEKPAPWYVSTLR